MDVTEDRPLMKAFLVSVWSEARESFTRETSPCIGSLAKLGSSTCLQVLPGVSFSQLFLNNVFHSWYHFFKLDSRRNSCSAFVLSRPATIVTHGYAYIGYDLLQHGMLNLECLVP